MEWPTLGRLADMQHAALQEFETNLPRFSGLVVERG